MKQASWTAPNQSCHKRKTEREKISLRIADKEETDDYLQIPSWPMRECLPSSQDPDFPYLSDIFCFYKPKRASNLKQQLATVVAENQRIGRGGTVCSARHESSHTPGNLNPRRGLESTYIQYSRIDVYRSRACGAHGRFMSVLSKVPAAQCKDPRGRDCVLGHDIEALVTQTTRLR